MHRAGIDHFSPGVDGISLELIPYDKTYFSLVLNEYRAENKRYEKLHENLVFDSGRGGLHDIFCGGQAELQKDRQELSHERQQGMQLWERLRLW
jgi:hypothetical protein